jgi:Polysaccharide biosynthesis enzyme WcbI
MFIWNKKAPVAISVAKNTRPSLVVLANCTHVSLALVLQKSGLFSKVDSLEVYSVSEENRQQEAEKIATADIILTIEHGESFGPLSTKALQQSNPGKVFSLPTPFFSGTIPDMSYLVRDGQISRAPALMGDYHSALLMKECQSGFSETDIINRYETGESFHRVDVKGIWDDNLRELKSREVGTNISISDYIESKTAEGEIGEVFLSFNHPKEGLINHIAQSFIKITFGANIEISPLSMTEHNLYHDALWPLHPVVAEILGLPQPSLPVYKTPDRLGGKRISIREFATCSCRFFNDGEAATEFNIVTPSYLNRRII